VKKRKKKLSREVSGSAHILSEDEKSFYYKSGSEGIIIGSGQYGVCEPSDEEADLLRVRNFRVILGPTLEAVEELNISEGKWIGLS